MAVVFPDWWTPEVRKRIKWIEDVCIALFRPLISGMEPVYWMPTDEQTHQVLFDEHEGYLRIYRLHGEVDLENNRTIHRVQFAAIHEDRNIAVDVMALVQWTLYAYEQTSYVSMPDGSKVAMQFHGETLGPILDPQQIRDERLISMTVELSTPWPKGLPNIRQILGL